MGPKW